MGPREKIGKLALGTVQFGLAYGISNRRGLVPVAEVAEILELAAVNGIDTLDTAQAYGTSEEVLGGCLKLSPHKFKVITKLKGVAPGEVAASLRASLAKTGVSGFYGVMLHSYEEFAADGAGYAALLKAKEAGLTARTGFSLYHPEQAEALLSGKVPFDLVQVPYSVLDRRFERVFPALKNAGVEVHVRSVFLQGLLLMAPDEIPAKLAKVTPKVSALRACAEANGVSLPALCAGFAFSEPLVDKVVMGVDGLGSFAANLSGLMGFFAAAPSGLGAALGGLAESDPDLILPQNWSKP